MATTETEKPMRKRHSPTKPIKLRLDPKLIAISAEEIRNDLSYPAPPPGRRSK